MPTVNFYLKKAEESTGKSLVYLQFKYKGNKELGLYLGRLMGIALAASNRFLSVDALIPLPLHKSKEHKRGYNQAAILATPLPS